jgi:hypothetical protein
VRWDDLTWTCHVCKQERPDRFISVLSTTVVNPRGVEMNVNVRYCNDQGACTLGAPDVAFRWEVGG